MKAREEWRRLPAWARGGLAFLGAAALAALVGWATPLGIGNAVFLAGALLILASLAQIRLGGRRRGVIARTRDGAAVKDWIPNEQREREIRRGVGLFLMGLALWAMLLAMALLRR